jgi:hypothetical protein
MTAAGQARARAVAFVASAVAQWSAFAHSDRTLIDRRARVEVVAHSAFVGGRFDADLHAFVAHSDSAVRI